MSHPMEDISILSLDHVLMFCFLFFVVQGSPGMSPIDLEVWTHLGVLFSLFLEPTEGLVQITYSVKHKAGSSRMLGYT